ncbi:protein ABHD18-like [Ptychodera flava]|uniref:protein ABHD18-like n=1 Tax=Ptychodera flava TaxID=63121 RepID=UPI00396A3240
MSRLDVVYRSLVLTKFFTRGWGKPDSLKRVFEFHKVIADRETCQHLIDQTYPIYIDKDEVSGECRLLEGHFLSPLQVHLPNIMPKEVETARFQMILPKKWKTKLKPVCVHLAGTGDHYYWRRRTMMARPLLKEYGIASILLENPYYGVRKPKEQLRSSLHNVSDLFVMGGALMLESSVLLHWCEKQGFGPLGLTGISMGGHMASLAATCWNKPVALIPCLSWSTATPVFTEGVFSQSIPWRLLETQYECHPEYEERIWKLLHSPGSNPFRLGKEFVRNYSEKVQQLKKMCNKKSSTDTPGNEDQENVKNDRISVRHSQSIDERPEMFDITSDADAEIHLKELKLQQSVMHEVAVNETQQNLKLNGTNPSYAVGGASPNPESREDKRIQRKSESSDGGKESKKPKPKNTTKENVQATKETKTQEGRGIFEKFKLPGKLNRKKSESEAQRVRHEYLSQETMKFMRGVMDEATFVGNFSKPVDTSLVLVVSAIRDAYVPTSNVPSIKEVWPDCEVRYLDCGHIHAALWKTNEFRRAIHDSFQMLTDKYHS